MEYPEVASRFYDVIQNRMHTGSGSRYYLSRIRTATGAILKKGMNRSTWSVFQTSGFCTCTETFRKTRSGKAPKEFINECGL